MRLPMSKVAVGDVGYTTLGSDVAVKVRCTGFDAAGAAVFEGIYPVGALRGPTTVPYLYGTAEEAQARARRVKVGPGKPTKPARSVFVVSERVTPEGPRSFWTKVGGAVENADGSITIKLDALPLTGTLQVRDGD